MKTKIILTAPQEDSIIKEWNSRKDNPPSVAELVKLVFGIDGDARCAEGIAIRTFLATKSLRKAKKVETLELTEDNKEFIKNNHDKMTGVEMSRIIFNNNTLFAGHPETRLVLNYKNSLNPTTTFKEEKSLKDFTPPRNDDQVIKIVNKIVLNAFNPSEINGATKKCLNSCIAYMNNERFIYEIETYQDATERKIFIANFIRHIYDKPDLTQQDLDIIILFSKEVVEHKRIEDQMSLLREQQIALQGNPDAKLTMNAVEMINNCTNNLSKSKKTQSDLLKDINEKRSDRLKKQIAETNSLLNLIAEWTEEEGRQKLIKLAESRKQKLGDEIDKLSEMDAMHAAIFGSTKEELLYG